MRMPKGVQRLLILLILLVPSGLYVWRDRTMPDFGSLHDDGIFFVTAKSLASNHFRIESLPEQPPQTKFPPLYPLYLSIAWRLDSHFPENLMTAMCLSWIALAACLGLSWTVYRRQKFSEVRCSIMVGLLAVNPYMILFGTHLFSEIFFTSLVLVVFIVAPRSSIAAGLVAGCAYLSRTAGIALLISVPAVYLWRREGRRALQFGAAMLPAVIGWSIWTRLNHAPAGDTTLLYYTDYIRYQFLNVGLDNLGVVLWKNIDQVLYGIGSLVFPKVFETLPMKILSEVIGIAMISGTVRLARRGVLVHYAAFAAVSAGMLFVWHFPPTERFVLPLYPLLIAGLAEELTHFARMLRAGFQHREASQRAAARIFAAIAVAIFGGAAVTEGYVTFAFLHEAAEQNRAKLRDLRRTYDWISANLPESATVLSYDDPLLYLYTGRRGNYLPLLPKWWYAEDHKSIIGAYREIAAYCQSRGLQYVLFTSQDLSREAGEEDRGAIEKAVHENPRLKQIFASGIAALYRVD